MWFVVAYRVTNQKEEDRILYEVVFSLAWLVLACLSFSDIMYSGWYGRHSTIYLHSTTVDVT